MVAVNRHGDAGEVSHVAGNLAVKATEGTRSGEFKKGVSMGTRVRSIHKCKTRAAGIEESMSTV